MTSKEQYNIENSFQQKPSGNPFEPQCDDRKN